MSKVIGIDLGTTNSCAAVVEGGATQIITNNLGGRTTPSIVAFTDKNERLIGTIAKRQAITNAANTIYAVKRLIGRKYNSPEVTRAKDHLPYQLVAAANGDVRIKIHDKLYSPQEISAMILQYIKASAEEYLGTQDLEAIITVPAYFDDSQRQATKDAGEIAGLKVKRIINEPTAAALAYGLGKNKSEKVAVYDLGGGTFDISILEINEGVFEVLSTCGDSFLGGEDFDQRISEWIIQEFSNETGIDLRNDILALQRLKEAAEKAKCELSTVTETSISLPFIAADETGPKHFDRVLTRQKMEELVKDLMERTLEPCEKALFDAKLNVGQVDKVILVGGQTRTPRIRQIVTDFFKKAASTEINPDEVVAVGAALQGGVLLGRREGHRPAGRHPPVAGRGNARRPLHQDHRPQLHHPPEENPALHHRGRQPDHGRDPRAAGRARAGRVQPLPGQVRAGRHRPGAPRRAAGRRHLRGGLQRHPARVGQGPEIRQGAGGEGHPVVRPVPGRDPADEGRGQDVLPEGHWSGRRSGWPSTGSTG